MKSNTWSRTYRNATWTIAALYCAGCGAESSSSTSAPVEAARAVQALEVPATQTGSPGYTQSYWDISSDRSAEYDSIEQLIQIEQEPPTDTFYASSTFYFHGEFATPQPEPDLTEPLGYMGLQTTTEGKKAIFSLWGASSAQSSGTARTFGGEGTGYQTFIDYPWQPGTPYQFRVTRTSEPDPVYATTTWTGYVTDLSDGTQTEIGRIQLPYTIGRLRPNTITFTEYYGDMRRCSEFLAMSPTTVLFGRPSANFGSVYDDSYVPTGEVVKNREDRPTCRDAASFHSSVSEYGTYAVHRMFGSHD